MVLPRELHRQNTLLLAWTYPGDRRDEDLPDPRDDPRNNGLVQVAGGNSCKQPTMRETMFFCDMHLYENLKANFDGAKSLFADDRS